MKSLCFMSNKKIFLAHVLPSLVNAKFVININFSVMLFSPTVYQDDLENLMGDMKLL